MPRSIIGTLAAAVLLVVTMPDGPAMTPAQTFAEPMFLLAQGTQSGKAQSRARAGASPEQGADPLLQQQLMDDPRLDGLMQNPQLQRRMQNPQVQQQLQQNQQLRQFYQLQYRPLPGTWTDNDD